MSDPHAFVWCVYDGQRLTSAERHVDCASLLDLRLAARLVKLKAHSARHMQGLDICKACALQLHGGRKLEQGPQHAHEANTCSNHEKPPDLRDKLGNIDGNNLVSHD